MSKPEPYASVWDAIADTPGEAANLQARAELMRQIAAIVKSGDGRKPRRRTTAESRNRASTIFSAAESRVSRSMHW